MNVAMISPTYPQANCGISTYTGYLTAELANFGEIRVVGAEQGQALLPRVLEATTWADVVHIQHAISNFGYLGSQSFALYTRLKRQNKPLLTTLHELPLFSIRSIKDRLVREYIRLLLRYIASQSHLLWVHSENSAEQLRKMGLRGTIEVIAHGTLPAQSISAIPHRQPTLGFFGFIAEHKGIHHIIEALPLMPGVSLNIAGSPRDTAGEKYLQRLHALIDQLGLGERVSFLGFLPDSRLSEFFASVDVILFPYNHATASGALHLALAHRCLILASNVPLFQEAKRRYGCLETFDITASPESLVRALEDLLQDKEKQNALHAGCERFVQASRWDRIAAQTWNTYHLLLHGSERSEPA